jgi:MFS family permease
VQRFGAKPMIVTGLLVLGIGLGIMSLVRATGNFWIDVLPASLVAAGGMSLAFIPSLGTAISAARPEEGGLASGIVNVGYQVGSAVGLAAMTAVATEFGANKIGDLPELASGFSAAFLGAGAIAIAGAAITAVTMRKPPSEPVLETIDNIP